MSFKSSFKRGLRKLRGLTVGNVYEGARVSKHHKRHRQRESADTANRSAVEALRSEARHLDQNYDLATSILDVLVNNVIGAGLVPQPVVSRVDGSLHEEFNAAVLSFWNDWTRKPEVTGEMNYAQAQRLMARSWFRDGEVFKQGVSGFIPSLDHQTKVPYSIELIESDFLPVGFNDEKRGIVQSIQKNGWGRPVLYWVYKVHPTELMHGQIRAGHEPDKSIPAKYITHLKLTNRIRQTRGISVFASCLNRIDSIKDGEESELVAMRVAAAMTGYIKKGTPDDYDGGIDTDNRDMQFNPGEIYELNPGEDVGTIASNRPNNNLIMFMSDQHRRLAGGTKTGFSSISKNYNGTYSAQRQELVEQYVSYQVLSEEFASKVVEPDYRSVVNLAIASGQLDVPPDVDMDTLFDVDIPTAIMPWIDPKKEADAFVQLIKAGIESRTHVIRRRGRNPETVFKQIKHEQEKHQITKKTKGEKNAGEKEEE